MSVGPWAARGWVALRLLLGAVFFYAGAIKLSAPQPFADSIASFALLPAPAIDPLVLGLPVFAMAVGGLLICGWLHRPAALAVLGLTGIFALALGSALARGLQVDCGCFGSGRATGRAWQWLALGRDLLLFAGAGALYLRGARPRQKATCPASA
jgi:putative oxidoreductase